MEGNPEAGFPALYRAADQGAIVGQRRLLTATCVRLTSLVTAAIFGSFTIVAGSVDASAIVAAGGLAMALVTEVYLLTVRPDRQWYEARAAAESAKTLAWRYLVGGEPFGCDVKDDEGVDLLLLRRFSEITTGIHSFAPIPTLEEECQVTATMRSIRALSLDERKQHYMSGRINDQRIWYVTKARYHERRGAQWSVAFAAMEALGLIAAVLNAAQLVDLDVPGIVGAVAAAGIAWLQTRQHQQLATSYSIAALELGDIVSRAEWPRTELEWAHFVDESEEAISRETMLWRGSRS
jgi:SMODS and SLOG-associating 2TM effector domain 3/SMODS and SLOG-associating 2TM effector domain 1